MPEPTDPMTQLAAGAAQLLEVYETYVQAGFTEQQSFELVKAILVVSLGGET